MAICGLISENIVDDCLKPMFGGTETTLYLFNRSDIAGYVEDAENPLLISEVTMKATKKGFKYEGKKASLRPNSELVVGDFQDLYRHGADFLVFDNSAATKQQLEKLVLGEVVAIVENKQKDADSTFEILGKDQGLKVLTLVRNQDNSGAYAIRVQSMDNGLEPHLPASFAVFVTDVYDYDATVTALNALITV